MYQTDLRGDLLITLLNGVGLVIGIFILYGLITRIMSIEALGEYLLVRRTAFSLVSILLVGINISLPYYIAQQNDSAYGVATLILFLVITVPLTAIISIIIYLGIFEGFSPTLALPFFFLTIAYAFQASAYGLLRGNLNILGAGLLQLIGTGLVPIFVFVLGKQLGIPLILLTIGSITFVLSLSVYLMKLGSVSFRLDLKQARQLLAYGFQRVPTFIADFILLAGVPLLIAGTAGKAGIAYVNSGISFIRLFMVTVMPLSIVLLPRFTKAIMAGHQASITRGLEILCRTIILIGLPLTLCLYVNTPVILNLWLGSDNEVGVRVVQVVILALPFYLLMETLRSPVDAASAKGYNSIIHGAGALTLLLMYFGLRLGNVSSIEAGAISFCAGYIVVAAASLYYSRRFYQIRILGLWYLLTVGTAVSVFYLFHVLIRHHLSDLASLIVGGVGMSMMLGMYFWKSRSEWILELKKLVLLGAEEGSSAASVVDHG
jgi:O-antigen/teichoic acid export membrane protein